MSSTCYVEAVWCLETRSGAGLGGAEAQVLVLLDAGVARIRLINRIAKPCGWVGKKRWRGERMRWLAGGGRTPHT